MKYRLYIWYAWGFGDHWYFVSEAKSIAELKELMKWKPTATWKIVREDGEIIKYQEAPGHCWRYGMTMPKIREIGGRLLELK